VSVEELSTISIFVNGVDTTADVIWAQTTFSVAAGAQPGTCQVVLKRGQTEVAPITPGDLIALYVNGKRMWWGYLFVLEQGYLFADDPEPKMILNGVDLNILFDKLIMYNHAHPTWYPDGGGAYQREKVTTDDGKVTGYIVSVPQGTTDKDYIQTMMADFDLNLVSPPIRYGQTPYPPNDTKINFVSTINTGDTGATWTPPSSGTTLRAFFQDVSNNIVRSQPGSAIWYIDPDGYIVWSDIDQTKAPWAVGDGGPDVVPCRDLTITTDVSSLKNDVLVFTGTLDPTPTSTQEQLLYVHKVNNPSVNLFGRFQWSEVMGSDWLAGMINARATKVLTQEGIPAMRAEFTVFKPGLYPGQIVNIFSDTHVFAVYDPDFGLQFLDGINIPIRAINMTFPTPNVVSFAVTCSYDTQDPWGLLLALKRPPTRGLVQPNFNVIDRTKTPTVYIEATPMTLVKEYAQALGGNHWQTTYAYIRNSLTVVVGGLRQTGVPEPAGTTAGFIELSPDTGQFSFKASAGAPVYVEYHVWHNLTS